MTNGREKKLHGMIISIIAPVDSRCAGGRDILNFLNFIPLTCNRFTANNTKISYSFQIVADVCMGRMLGKGKESDPTDASANVLTNASADC